MKNKDQFLQIRVTPAKKTAIKRAADRAGVDMSCCVLGKLFPSVQQRIGELFQLLHTDKENRRFVLAEINDVLTQLAPGEFSAAVADPPPAGQDPYLANYVAAMVEMAAHRKKLRPPGWTAAVRPLPQPGFGTSLPGSRFYLLTQSPAQFRRRNIFFDAGVGDRI